MQPHALATFARSTALVLTSTLLALSFFALLTPVAHASSSSDWWQEQPTCELNVNDSTVSHGDTVILTWNSTNASNVTLSGYGSVASSGTQAVHNLTNTRTFILTVSGNGSTQTCSRTVTVSSDSSNAPTCWINANPSSVSENGSTTLSWGSTNAHSAHITDLGSVSNSGSRTVYPNHSRTYTMTVYNTSGQSGTCQTHVSTHDYDTAPNCSISLSHNSSGYQYNQPATLSWNTTGNATSAHINSIGTVSLSGSRTVYPSSGQSYTMTVTGPGGSRTCSTGYSHPSGSVSCTLTNSPDLVTPGGSAVLSWQTFGNRVRSAYLTDIGSVSANGGSTVVYPNAGRTYTLTVEDYSGNTNTCSTWVGLTSGTVYTPTYPIYTTPIYTYPTPTTHVTLNKLPYTGVAFGPLGTALYYITFATILVGIGYTTLLWHRGSLRFAFSRFSRSYGPTHTFYDEEEEEEDEDGSAAVLARSLKQ
jgi:hypothetical protein